MKFVRTIIETLILVLALIQAPLFFYFTSGKVKTLGLTAYAITGFCLTAFMFYLALSRNLKHNGFSVALLCASFAIGLLTLRPDVIEYLDWKYRLDERAAIIKQVEQSKFRPDKYGLAHVPQNTFLPVSNGGNDILIKKNLRGVTSVEFFTDRTIVEHYSAFLYTNDPYEIGTMDRSSEHDKHFARKLDDSWYIVHY